MHFIEGMPETLKPEQLAALDAAYKFTGTPNGEIAQRWYPLAVRSGYTQAQRGDRRVPAEDRPAQADHADLRANW